MNNIDHIKEKTIWMIWSGTNKMSQARYNCYKQFCEINKDCNVRLITHEDIDLLDGIHRGFKFLSETHKADYLRCYLMHHYGGGYADVKAASHSWAEVFEEFTKNENLYVIGYPECGPWDVARIDLCRLEPQKIKYLRDYTLDENGNWTSQHVQEHWQKTIGNGSYICQKNTPFTQNWWDALNEKMDLYYDELEKNPAKWAQDQFGVPNPNNPEEISKYPIPWTDICGSIFHPLNIKYSNFIKQNPQIRHDNNYEYR